MLSITLHESLSNDVISALAVQFNVARLLILHNHRHALASRIELKHVQQLEPLCVPSDIADHQDVIRLAAHELETLVFGTFNQGLLVRTCCIVHSLVLVNDDCVTDCEMHQTIVKSLVLRIVVVIQDSLNVLLILELQAVWVLVEVDGLLR